MLEVADSQITPFNVPQRDEAARQVSSCEVQTRENTLIDATKTTSDDITLAVVPSEDQRQAAGSREKAEDEQGGN